MSFEAHSQPGKSAESFRARGRGFGLALTRTGASISLRGTHPDNSDTRTPDGDTTNQIVAMNLKGPRSNVIPKGVDELAGKINHIIGNDPRKWRTNIPTFEKVLYEQVYRGIDLVYYGNQKELEYDFRVAPGADARLIRLQFPGARGLRLGAEGDLLIANDAGEVRLVKPISYQEIGNARQTVESSYVIKRNQVSFRLGRYDHTLPLVIDPVLVYSTFLGGTSVDEALGIAVDSSGSAYVTGDTFSADFPVNSFQTTKNTGADVFVTKLNPAGTAIVYSTFVGGIGTDQANAIAVDGAGNAYVTGQTLSPDFPLASALHGTYSGFGDAFAFQLNAAGSGLVYSTYFGGTSFDAGYAVAVDQAGNTYLAGRSDSRDFVTSNAIQPSKTGTPIFKTSDGAATWAPSDSGIVAAVVNAITFDPLNPNIVYAGCDNGVFKSTDGGANWSLANRQPGTPIQAIAVDPINSLVVYAGTSTGVMKSTDGGINFTSIPIPPNSIRTVVIDPVTPANIYAIATTGANFFRSTNGGASWSTTNLSSGGGISQLNGLSIDPASPSTIYVGSNRGVLKSTNSGLVFATANSGINFEVIRALAIDRTTPATLYCGSNSGIFKSTNSGTSWTTISNNLGLAPVLSIAIDPANSSVIYINAQSSSTIFKTIDGGNTWNAAATGYVSPIVNALAFNPANSASLLAATSTFSEGFVAKIGPGGASQIYSTYLGGTLGDEGDGVAADSAGRAYIAGTTSSQDFPLLNAFLARGDNFTSDAFLTILNANGTLATSTYLGGDSSDFGRGIALDSANNIYIAGHTFSTMFPGPGGLQPAAAVGTSFDAFVTKLNPTASAILYTTSIGGNSSDQCFGLALDGSGGAYITGTTSSSNFPIVGEFQPTTSFPPDAFVTKLSPNGSIFFSLYLGGISNDSGKAIAVDSSGNAYVAGSTFSENFPTKNPVRTYSGNTDAFVVKLGPSTELTLTMTDSPDPVSFGSDLTYNLQVKNNGELTATGVSLADNLPNGATLVSASPSQGSCSGAAAITCGLGTLAGGASASITIVIKPPATKTISSTATVSANEPDADATNNVVTATTQVLFADLSAAVSASSGKVAPGSKVIYLITVRNNDGVTADVTVSDNLPPETSFVSCSSTGTCGGSGNNRTITFPSLAAGQIVSVVLVAQVNAAEGTVISNTVTAGSSLPDNNAGNNSVSASITATSPLSLKGAGKIAFASGHVFTVPADGSSPAALVPNIPGAVGPSWSPDGTKIAYQYDIFVRSPSTREIDVANPDGTAIVKIADNASSQNSRIAWSPSGQRIAYVGSDGLIYLANSDGSGFAKLPGSPTFVNDLDWSPDGTKLLVTKEPDLYKIELDGVVFTKLSNSGIGPDGQFSYIKGRWSPDMSKILAVRKSNNLSDVVFMNPDGTGVARVLNLSGTSSASWAPDGSRIAFYVGSEVHAINLDGSAETKLATGETCCGVGATDWQPLPGVAPQPPPPTVAYTISGHAPDGTFLLLSGTRTGYFNADRNGDYTFVNLPAGGTYTITPDSNISTYDPLSRTYSNLAGNQTGADFAIAGKVNYSVSGRLTDVNGSAIVGAQLTLSGGFPSPVMTNTDGNGRYSFNNLLLGRNYSVFPSLNQAHNYQPNSRFFFFYDKTNPTHVADFIGFKNTPVTISGRVFDGANPGVGVAGVQVDISNAGKTTTTDATGNYSFANLTPGSDYTVTVNAPSVAVVPNQIPFKGVIANQQAYFVRYGAPTIRSISGRAVTSLGAPMDHMLVTLSGDANLTSITDQDGGYSFNVPDGFSYVVRPFLLGFNFLPWEVTLQKLSGNSTGKDFVGTNPSFSGTNPIFQFASPFLTASEGSGSVSITVTRSGSGREETVNYATSNGTADSRSDYTYSAGTLHFGVGESTKSFKILLADDVFVENPESVLLILSNPGAGNLDVNSVATLTIIDNDTTPPAANPLDDAGFFVRQQYVDFLNREPDSAGLAFWTNEIASCGNNQQCIEVKRINVSASFFLSIEFQDTGYLVERTYKAAYGDATGTSTFPSAHQLPVPIVRLTDFLSDTQKIGQGVVVLQPAWEQALENNKQAFFAEFVQRQRFVTEFPVSMTPAQFVDKLDQRAGRVLSSSELATAVSLFGGAANSASTTARAQAVRQVASDTDLYNAEFNRAFVLMQYFGYLRRNPDDLQDSDYTGYDFWLTKLNQFNGSYLDAEMVKAFLSSIEYRKRLGP